MPDTFPPPHVFFFLTALSSLFQSSPFTFSLSPFLFLLSLSSSPSPSCPFCFLSLPALAYFFFPLSLAFSSPLPISLFPLSPSLSPPSPFLSLPPLHSSVFPLSLLLCNSCFKPIPTPINTLPTHSTYISLPSFVPMHSAHPTLYQNFQLPRMCYRKRNSDNSLQFFKHVSKKKNNFSTVYPKPGPAPVLHGPINRRQPLQRVWSINGKRNYKNPS
jgi:hypothetical protein